MNIRDVEENIIALLDGKSEFGIEFIYDLLLAYGKPKSSITRLKSGTYNLSKKEGEILWKKVLFFNKLPGYDTLRLILCKKAILVEGDSDELIVQKAYMLSHDGKLPIQEGIDVISVGMSFLRFLEIANKIEKDVYVVTDNDGDFERKIAKKYAKYSNHSKIKIFADKNNSFNTLEPQIVNANENQLDCLREVINVNAINYPDAQSLAKYMQSHKTKTALKLFKTNSPIKIPQYILDAVSGL